jgi:hypothetical protein
MIALPTASTHVTGLREDAARALGAASGVLTDTRGDA